MFVANLSPVPRYGYRLGLPRSGRWREALNTDSSFYGGSDVGNLGGVQPEPIPWHNQAFSAEVTLPPLAADLARSGRGMSSERAPGEPYPWERPLGAHQIDDVRAEFRVWAPRARRRRCWCSTVSATR